MPAELAEVKPGFDSTTTYYDWAVGAENNGDLTSAMQEGFVKLMVGDMTAEELVKECGRNLWRISKKKIRNTWLN